MRVLGFTALFVIVFGACGTAGPEGGAGATPEQTLDTYRAFLSAGALTAEAEVLTPESRELLERGYSSAQQATEAAALDRAGSGQTVIRGDRAVIRFPESSRTSPYFLRNSDVGWQVDLAGMASSIVFDAQNRWSFRSTSHPYMFAFR